MTWVKTNDQKNTLMPRRRRPKAATPAFQFYVKDFMTGTMTMSLAEVGGYARLLCHQWDTRSVPGNDMAALARAMVCDRAEAELIWPKIRTKFRQKSDGVWINSRLEKERRKQATYRKSQSDKGKRSAEKRTAVQPRLNRDPNRKSTLQSSPSGSIPPVVPQGGRSRRRRRSFDAVADPIAVNQAIETRRRRQLMADAGMSDVEIEAVLEREFEARKAAS